MGTADLVLTPPWNPKGNNRALLVQCKHTKRMDYIEPFERDHLNYLQQINSGNVIVAFKDSKGKVFIKQWESQTTIPIEEFMLEEYGIPMVYTEILSRYNKNERPIHMYYVPHEIYTNKNGEISEKPIAPFADLYYENVYFPHVPENYRINHE